MKYSKIRFISDYYIILVLEINIKKDIIINDIDYKLYIYILKNNDETWINSSLTNLNCDIYFLNYFFYFQKIKIINNYKKYFKKNPRIFMILIWK